MAMYGMSYRFKWCKHIHRSIDVLWTRDYVFFFFWQTTQHLSIAFRDGHGQTCFCTSHSLSTPKTSQHNLIFNIMISSINSQRVHYPSHIIKSIRSNYARIINGNGGGLLPTKSMKSYTIHILSVPQKYGRRACLVWKSWKKPGVTRRNKKKITKKHRRVMPLIKESRCVLMNPIRNNRTGQKQQLDHFVQYNER